MDIGVFYQMQVPKPWTSRSEIDCYNDMLEQVAYADQIGMSSVWVAEHHFRSEWSHSSAPDITLGAISQRTSNIRLGIAVVVSPIHHPLHTAARMATLDILSNGRVDVGVGRSGYPHQMVAFGTNLEDATSIVDESMEILPRAWAEGEFSHQGRHFQIPQRQVFPKPIQKPHPPMWLGCSQEETFKKAGDMGLGCLAMDGNPERLGQMIRIYREASENANPIGKLVRNRVAVSGVAFCHEDREVAFQRGAELIDWYRSLQRQRNTIVWKEQDKTNVPQDYKWHYQKSADALARQDETPSIELIRRGDFCIGNPDDCIKFMEPYQEADVDEMIPLYQIGPIKHNEVMNTLQLFDKYVIPHFQKSANSSPSATS